MQVSAACQDGQQFGHVGLGAAGLSRIEQVCRLGRHQGRRFRIRISLGDRELDTLVLADRPVKDDALPGIGTGFFDEPAGIADAFVRNQDTFGVHAVEDITEPPAFLADQTVGGNSHVVKEDLGRIVIQHGADRLDGQPLAEGFAHVDEENR